ncbi:MAG: lipopolysaccharide biosynthesis protein [Microbacterium sp.]
MRFVRRILRLLDTPAGISIGRMTTQALSLVTAPIIAQAIGPTGRGMTAAALAAVTITGVAIGMGVPLAVRRRAVDPEQRDDAVRSARLIAWGTVVPAGLIGVVLVLTLLSDLDLLGSIAFLCAMSMAGLTVSWVTDTNVLVADRRYFRILWVGSIQTISYFLVVVVMWAVGALSVAAVLFAYAAGTLAAFVLGRYWVRTTRDKAQSVRSLLREGMKLWGSQAAEIASARLDQLLVLPIIGAGPTGLYSVAVTMGNLPVSIGLAFGTSAFRDFVNDRSLERMRTAIRMAVAIAGSLAAVVALASIWGIPLLFGAEFQGAVILTFVTVVGGVAVTGNYVCSMALVALQRGVSMTLVQISGLIVGLGLLVPAGHIWGALGAAVASTVGYFATFVGALLVLRIRPWAAIPGPRDFRDGMAVFLGRK